MCRGCTACGRRTKPGNGKTGMGLPKSTVMASSIARWYAPPFRGMPMLECRATGAEAMAAIRKSEFEEAHMNVAAHRVLGSFLIGAAATSASAVDLSIDSVTILHPV